MFQFANWYITGHGVFLGHKVGWGIAYCRRFLAINWEKVGTCLKVCYMFDVCSSNKALYIYMYPLVN